jgi:tetratricopeptide (TPR) repeat protein
MPGRPAVPSGAAGRVPRNLRGGGPCRAGTAIGDAGAGPQLLARVLFLRLLALTGFQHAEDALATTRDLLAVPAAPAPLVATARIMELSAAMTLGRVEEARSLREALSDAVARARSPVLDMQHAFVRAALLDLEGRLDEAEKVLAPYVRAGALENNHILSSWTSQRCERALQRGTLSDLVEELAAVRRRTGLDGYGGAQALGLLELGRREEARAVVDTMRTGPRDYGWFGAVASLLLVAVELGDLERVRSLRHQLLPYQGRLGVLGSCTSILGAVSGFVGEASLALGELDAAREQLTAAVELLERADSPYWSARARTALARCG